MKSIILVIVIGIAIAFSGCTESKDITSAVKALPEVQQFLNEHPTAKITTTYWSKEEVEKSVNEISQQCDKPITPVAMYKATVSEGELKFISWINVDTQIVICSVTQGSGNFVNQPTSTKTQSPTRTPYIQPPQSSIRATTTGSSFVVIEHQGGDDLNLRDVKIIVEQGTSTAIFDPVSPNNDKFIAGDKLIITQKGMSLNEKLIYSKNIIINLTDKKLGEMSITMINRSGQQIASMKIRGGNFFAQNSNEIVPIPPQASLRAVKSGKGFVNIVHQGGSDIYLRDVKITVVAENSKAIYDTAGQSLDEFIAGDTLTITPTGISLNGRTLTNGKISIEPAEDTSGEIAIYLFDNWSGYDIGEIRIRAEDVFFI